MNHTPRLNQTRHQGSPADFIPLGEALAHADRCLAEGRLEEAEAVCRRILNIHPILPEARHILGLVAHRSGRLGEAIEHVKWATDFAPQNAIFHSNLCEMYRQAGRIDLAIEAGRRAVELAPALAVAWSNLGAALIDARDYEEAVKAYRRAIAKDPNSAKVHWNLGNALYELNRHEKAITAYRRAVSLDPAFALAWCNLGVALFQSKEYEEAVRAHRRAIASEPGLAHAHFHLANALHALKRFGEAIAAYRRAVTLDPSHVDAWSNLGTALHDDGFYSEGMSALRRAIALAPDNGNAHWFLSLLLLMRGDFAGGWAEHEWRLHATDRKAPRPPERPWRGESLAGKHIYVRAEQGFGDSLQFVRYIPWLVKRAGKVSLRAGDRLVSLMRESLPDVDVLDDSTAPERYDYDIVLMSLPHVFETRFETIPADVPYLRAPEAALARWREKLAPMAGLKVGLVWAGNPDHTNDWRRSLDPALLAPLLHVPGASFASLQSGPSAAHLSRLKGDAQRILDLSRDLGDFADTAGAIMELDVVITIDSSMAHLAGALGKPVWLLLADIADWRWLLEREDTPWYPNMRLFRQAAGEDWSAVIARVTRALGLAVDDSSQLMPFKAEGERRAAEAHAILARDLAAALQAGAAIAAPMDAAEMAALAEQKLRNGLLGEAEDLCHRALRQQPRNAHVIHMLGLIAHQSGSTSDAIARIHRAIALNPGEAVYHANLAELYRLNGRTGEAVAAGRRAAELDPGSAVAWDNLGIALAEIKNYPEAAKAHQRAIAANPEFAQAHFNLGNVLRELRRCDEAVEAYRRAAALDPASSVVWSNLGAALCDVESYEEAVIAYQRAIAAGADVARAHWHLGNALHELARFDEAIEAFRRAVDLDPAFAFAWVNLGLALARQAREEEAVAAFGRALALAPDLVPAHFHFGNVLYRLTRFAEAIEAYRRVIALDPLHVDAWSNLGRALHGSGHYGEGIVALRQAAVLAPDHADARWALGMFLLMLGDFNAGWFEHEWRLSSAKHRTPSPPARPWRGENLVGRHIFVRAEQGFGDTMQFARYIPWLAKRAGKVSFKVHSELVALMRESLPEVEILGGDGDPGPYDCDILAMSLPHIFKTRFETIPASIPYLRAPAEAVARWREKLAAMPGMKIGLVWAGDPNHPDDSRRSLDPALLAPLLRLPGVSFVSLQFGPRAGDLARLGEDAQRVTDLAPELGDFADSAGAVMALDLVISIDSSPAHLAGALGKPVWVLLPDLADWRWLVGREDSPWYPNMRLFRQAAGEDWPIVTNRLVEALNLAVVDPSFLMPFKEEGEWRAAAANTLLEREALQARSDTTAPAMTSAEMVHLAEQKLRQGALSDAEELCQHALVQQQGFDKAQTIHLLGLIAHHSGKTVEAIARIRRAIHLQPGEAVYHANLGELYRLIGNTEQAVAACRRAVELDPNYPAAFNNLGIALFDGGKYDEAIAHFERAIVLQPDFAQAHCNRGNGLVRLQRWAEAEFAYRRALEISPAFVDAWNNLGTCLRELKRMEEAEFAFRRALALKPQDPHILENMASLPKHFVSASALAIQS